MMTNNSTVRSWIKPTVCILTTFCLLLLSSGCRVDQSGQNPIGWRDWLPRSHRGLVRTRLLPRQESSIPTIRERAIADSPEINPAKDLATSPDQIAPAPPKTTIATSPPAPTPETDIQDLIAIEKDLPTLETTPQASSLVEEAALDKPSNLDEPTGETSEAQVPTAESKPAENDPVETPAENEPANQEESKDEAADSEPLPEESLERLETSDKESAEEKSPEDAVNTQSILQPQIEATPLQPIVSRPNTNSDANAVVAPQPALLPTLSSQLANLSSDADKEIARTILKHFKQLKEQGVLHHFSISVHVTNGTAELKGQLISQAQHEMLVDTVRATEGVKRIKNHLLITVPDLDAAKDQAEADIPEKKPTTETAKKPIELPDPVEEDLLNIR